MAKREPLLMHLYRENGFREGTRAAEFIVSWGIYSEKLPSGEVPTMDGFSAFWRESQATSYRGLRAFRGAFPDDPFPDRVWAVIAKHVEARKVAAASRDAMFVEAVWS
jgi:hypothetical protein